MDAEHRDKLLSLKTLKSVITNIDRPEDKNGAENLRYTKTLCLPPHKH
jgi:hypothetical protein